MASLSIMMKQQGYTITGSDSNIYPPMSEYLYKNNVKIHEGYSTHKIDQIRPDVFVIGNSLSRGNPEVEYALANHLPYFSFSELLKEKFIRGNTSLVIAGTHGKTTTTALTAFIFDTCGLEPGFFIGGIDRNFDCAARACTKKPSFFITEGDEYDTCFFDKRSKFFHYLPDYFVINNIEFDHADIFDNIENIKKSFVFAMRQIPSNGTVLVNGDCQNSLDVAEHSPAEVIRFGMNENNDARITHIKFIESEHKSKFQLIFRKEKFQWKTSLYGEFNIRNATASILLALLQNVSPKKIQQALATFQKPLRRLEKLTHNTKILVFDDFAHHPTAIKQTLQALRIAYPQKKIWAIFEPRSNTCIRKTHQEAFLNSFQNATSTIFFKIFNESRVQPQERLDIPFIVSTLTKKGKRASFFQDIEELYAYLIKNIPQDSLIVIMSQGSFYNIPTKLATYFDDAYQI